MQAVLWKNPIDQLADSLQRGKNPGNHDVPVLASVPNLPGWGWDQWSGIWKFVSNLLALWLPSLSLHNDFQKFPKEWKIIACLLSKRSLIIMWVHSPNFFKLGESLGWFFTLWVSHKWKHQSESCHVSKMGFISSKQRVAAMAGI